MITGPKTREEVEKHWGLRTTAIEPLLIPFRERPPHCDIHPLNFQKDKDAIGQSKHEGKDMKCVICHGENIKVMDVKEEHAIGNNIVYIPVKAPVCMTCGERYYDRRTMQFLEEVEGKLNKTQVGLKEVGKVLMYEEKG